MNWETEIYDDWFNGIDEANKIPDSKTMRKWFMGGEDIDIEMKERYSILTDIYVPEYNNVVELYSMLNEPIESIESNLFNWKKRFLGRIILGDQIFRHIYRGNKHAYIWERTNRNAVMNLMLKLQWNVEKVWSIFNPCEILFLLLPLVHYEPRRDNNIQYSISSNTYYEINKVLNFWKESLDLVKSLVMNNKDDIIKYTDFINKAIRNVRRHYEELKMNDGRYSSRDTMYS